ncbi:hypothetical protein O181_003171 [Austropuccinia psidii MF-1]|uniref:Uncharacterized protein n=1 Tax=Austropuccinia psidii MF-1 TaxID=1389203 RepID=A0A9Q3BDB6_9BASI|nr:hypothetical protein [Austropuccinia psidii MF-1]
MEHGQQEVQPIITLSRTWRKFPEDLSPSDTLQRPYGNQQRMQSQQITIEPDGAYSDSFRLTRSKPTGLLISFTPFRKQQTGDQLSPFFTIPGIFQEKTGIQREKQHFFQDVAKRVRPNDPEAAVVGERSTQEPEIAVNTSRISSPINRNITPTPNGHNVVKPESNFNNDQLWFEMDQFAVQTQ